jgi:transcriptional regulator with XRE-family HTH domain
MCNFFTPYENILTLPYQSSYGAKKLHIAFSDQNLIKISLSVIFPIKKESYMPDDTKKDLHDKLRALRRSRGLSVNELAEKMGENYQKVGRIERGKRALTVDYLMKLSSALDTPVETFLSEKEKREAPAPKENIPALDPSLLSAIVVQIEKAAQKNSWVLSPEKKGELITKTFELASQFPKEKRQRFLSSFFDWLIVFSSPTSQQI